MSFASLRFRLLVAAVGFVIAALILSAIWLTILFQRHVENWVDAELTAWLDQLISGIDAGPNGTLIVARPPADPRFERPMSGLYWEVAAPGTRFPVRTSADWACGRLLRNDRSVAAAATDPFERLDLLELGDVPEIGSTCHVLPSSVSSVHASS